MTSPHRIHDDVSDRSGALARSAANGNVCCGLQNWRSLFHYVRKLNPMAPMRLSPSTSKA